MGLLSSIGNSYRRWAGKGLPGGGRTSSDRISLYRESAADTDAASHDLSYEDAVLDAELRHFMHRELGRAQPPKGVFLKLLSAVYYDEVREGRLRSRCKAALSAPVRSYGAFAAPYAARLVSGIAAVALLLVFVSANARFEGTSAYSTLPGAHSTAAHRSLERSEGGIDRPRTGGTPSGAYEAYAYHPAELGRPAAREVRLPAAEREEPFRYRDGDRMGSEF
jgi:hypothetical protein